MRNYALEKEREGMKERLIRYLPLDICVITYNRLPYLKKCIWSIIASTTVPYRLFVGDDGSDDGTRIWLQEMVNRKLIYRVMTRNENVGTVRNANELIRETNSKVFVIIQDDMYLYRYWDYAVLDIYTHYYKCGLVSFYDYLRFYRDTDIVKLNDSVCKVTRT